MKNNYWLVCAFLAAPLGCSLEQPSGEENFNTVEQKLVHTPKDGLFFEDEFTSDMTGWTVYNMARSAMTTTEGYEDTGSFGTAATKSASGLAFILSAPIDLSDVQGTPLLRFQHFLNDPGSNTTVYVHNAAEPFQQVSSLSSSDEWQTEYISLEDFAGEDSVQILFISWTADVFQVDDVSVGDRSLVDGPFDTRAFLINPGYFKYPRAWEWRTDPNAPYSGPRSGPFSNEGGSTSWPEDATTGSNDIWLRTLAFVSGSEDLNRLRFWARWDDRLEIRVNGTLVVDERSWTPSYQRLTPLANAFVYGNNTIEVHARDIGGGRFVDVGLERLPTTSWIPVTTVPSTYGYGRSHKLAGFSEIIHDYVETRVVPGVAFSLYKNGSRVLDIAAGHRDRERTEPMQINPVMRLASVDKSYTIVAAQKLIDDGFVLANGQTLKRNTPVFPLLRDWYGFPASAGSAGPYTDVITVGDLMDHTSFVRNFSEGGSGNFYSVSGATPGRENRHDNAVYIHNRGCSKRPGSATAQYNNGGYMLLRYFMDEILPNGLQTYLQSEFSSDVFVVYEALAGRQPSEPAYEVFDEPYNRWINLENYLALAATPRALAELAVDYNLTTGAASPYGGASGSCIERNGGMSGSTAFALQCPRGITMGLTFNGNPQGFNYDDLKRALRDHALSLSDTDYP